MIKFQELFSNNVVCLERFHMALNYLSIMGRKLCFFVLALINISVYGLVIFIALFVFNDFQ